MNLPPDRSQPPAAGAAPVHAFPDYARHRLANGLECLLLVRRDLPLADLMLLLPAGGERNPTSRSGLASVTAALTDEGSRRRSGLELALDVERIGASLATGADWESAQVEISLLSSDLEVGLRTLAEVALEPVFPEGEVERVQRQVLTEITRRRDQPPLLAEQALAAALYGGTAYAHLLQGERSSIEAMTRDELVRFHEKRYVPSGSFLLLGGDLDPERVLPLVEECFGDWGNAHPDDGAPSIEAVSAQRRVLVVDLPHAAQTELRIGHPGVPRTHPDRVRLGVLNALFGGKFTSRLNLNLRERHGYTYGAWSRFVDRRGAGPFLVGAAVANDIAGAAVAETLGELERLRDEPVAPDEIEDTKSYLIGVFPYTLQRLDGLLARLADLAVHGLPDGYFERSLDEIRATTSAELLELARRHVRPHEAVVVAAGPAEILRPQLEAYAEVEVIREE